MAIQTSGFQVRTMPRFTAPNPNLVAFTPQPVAQGLGDMFKLAQQYEQLKASKALQAELMATQEGRIGAQQARDLSTIQLTPAQTQYALGKIASDMPNVEARGLLEGEDIARNRALIPAEQAARSAALDIQTQRDLSGLVNVPAFAKYEGEKIASDLSLLGPITDARKAQALAQTAQSGNDLALAPVVRGAQEAELGLRTSQARLGQTTAPLEAHVKILDLTDKITNAKTDADRRRAIQDLNMELVRSQIEENLAQAKMMPKGVDPVAVLGRFHTMQSQVVNEQQKLLNTKVPNPNGEGQMSLAMYLAQTRDPETNKIGTERTGFLWRNKSAKKTNPEAEGLVAQLKSLDSQFNDIQSESSKYFRDAMPETQKIDKKDQDAIEWLQDPRNQSSPYYQGVLNTLKQKGIIQ